MSEAEAPLEADRVEGAPHPRDALRLIGQDAAEAGFLDAHAGGRLHHAWLLTGPRGVGKATLAWRIARFLLAEPADEGGLFGDAPPAPASLEIAPDHPIARRVAALSEPRLKLIRRGWDEKAKRLKTVISVDDVRGLNSFFGLSAAEGGRRVVIVDAADEMNVSAANALLKLLEEPPDRATLLLISHRPARLLPTIRSRCRELRLAPLAPDALAEAVAAAGFAPPEDAGALAELSGGSVGEAIRMLSGDGLALYAEIVGIAATLPSADRPRAIALAEAAAGRGAEDRLDLTLRLLDLVTARLARTGAGHPPRAEAAPGEQAMLARMSPNAEAARHWAAAQQALSARAGHARAVNLDPATLILDMVLTMNQTAAEVSARR